MMKHLLLSFPLLFFFTFSCSRQPIDFEAARFLYQENQLEEALPILEELSEQEPPDPMVLAYLAETYRRFGKKDQAVATARRCLALDPCNAFAHTVIGEASNPLVGEWSGADAETTWAHLLKAGDCDPKDGNPWLMIWGESVRRGDKDMLSKAAEKMIETGFFPKALLAYSEWVLSTLPENAILITNGDMDTYPLVALQEVEELRRDVIVINRGMLSLPWTARFLRDVKGVALPFNDAELDDLQSRKGDDGVIETPSDDIIRGWIQMWKEGNIRNRIAFAMTVPREFPSHFDVPLQYAGAYRIVAPEETDGPDISTIMSGLERFTPEDFFGPWVSEQDRSPVRRVGTKNIVRNVTYAAMTLAEELSKSGNTDAGLVWLTMAEALDAGSDLGPVYRDRIVVLKEKIAP